MSGADIITLGCRLNTFESEIIRDACAQAGLENAVVVNTCTVTAEAERQARQTIRRARRDNPGAKLIVTGCAAQIDPDRFAAMAEVDHVFGNEEKLNRETYANLVDGPAIAVSDIMAVRETAPHLVSGFDGRTRAFVQVQQGCDHRCTFCIIPFARGNHRSVGMGAVTDQVRALIDGGYREVVLTGVDISSYGADLPGAPRLGDLVRRLLDSVPELERLRLSSIDPAAVDDTLIETLGDDPRLMPHVHLSLQAMEDTILKRMKRRHSVTEVMRLADRLRRARPDVVFGADLIAGFPTETDTMFETTFVNVRDLGIPHLHVFPYSERPGTPASRMPKVDKRIRKERAARLRALGETTLSHCLQERTGSSVRVLVEKPGMGLSEHFLPASLDGLAETGQIVAARVTGNDNGRLLATVSP